MILIDQNKSHMFNGPSHFPMEQGLSLKWAANRYLFLFNYAYKAYLLSYKVIKELKYMITCFMNSLSVISLMLHIFDCKTDTDHIIYSSNV